MSKKNFKTGILEHWKECWTKISSNTSCGTSYDLNQIKTNFITTVHLRHLKFNMVAFYFFLCGKK